MNHPDHGSGRHPQFPAPSPRQQAGSTGSSNIRIIAGGIGAGALLLTLLLLWAVVTSVLDTDPSADPHGYVMMFATLAGFPVAVLTAVALPMALPRHRWRRGWVIGVGVLGCWVAATVACFHYADRHPHLPRHYLGPSLPVAFGARVTDGKLTIWTGSRCTQVTHVGLAFDQNKAILLLDSTDPDGVVVEHLALSGPYPAGLTVTLPLPNDFDWHTQTELSLRIYAAPAGNDSTTDLREVIAGSADHPDDTYFFNGIGWLNPAEVSEQDGTTFLTTCTPDPAKHPK